MIGSFRWNLFAGAVGFAGTLLASFPRNVWKTALIHSFYSFLFLILFTFVVRWVLALLIASSGVRSGPGDIQETGTEPHKGRTIDLSTPDNGEMPGSQTEQGSEDSLSFTPLNPPKLTTKMDQDPEELVKALRRMTEE
ncbi:hypothetical protein [Gorillibacterium sp. sgz5001074]|uniref:hypothetical protein n=1 Tax=Gorillibacterium sp. sgz5001074 TaxID=3446695 RepID=UPI003F67840A